MVLIVLTRLVYIHRLGHPKNTEEIRRSTGRHGSQDYLSILHVKYDPVTWTNPDYIAKFFRQNYLALPEEPSHTMSICGMIILLTLPTARGFSRGTD